MSATRHIVKAESIKGILASDREFAQALFASSPKDLNRYGVELNAMERYVKDSKFRKSTKSVSVNDIGKLDYDLDTLMSVYFLLRNGAKLASHPARRFKKQTIPYERSSSLDDEYNDLNDSLFSTSNFRNGKFLKNSALQVRNKGQTLMKLLRKVQANAKAAQHSLDNSDFDYEN